MDKRQRHILEALEKHKFDQDAANLNPIWQGSDVTPGVFMHDWKVLVEKGYVRGWNVTNQMNQEIVGTGRITPQGEEALRELAHTTSIQEWQNEPGAEDRLQNLEYFAERHEEAVTQDAQAIESLKADVKELLSLIRLLDAFGAKQPFGNVQENAYKEFQERIKNMLEKHKFPPQN